MGCGGSQPIDYRSRRKVTDLQGRPFNIYSQEILASNGLIHEEMVQAIREMDPM